MATLVLRQGGEPVAILKNGERIELKDSFAPASPALPAGSRMPLRLALEAILAVLLESARVQWTHLRREMAFVRRNLRHWRIRLGNKIHPYKEQLAGLFTPARNRALTLLGLSLTGSLFLYLIWEVVRSIPYQAWPFMVAVPWLPWVFWLIWRLDRIRGLLGSFFQRVRRLPVSILIAGVSWLWLSSTYLVVRSLAGEYIPWLTNWVVVGFALGWPILPVTTLILIRKKELPLNLLGFSQDLTGEWTWDRWRPYNLTMLIATAYLTVYYRPWGLVPAGFLLYSFLWARTSMRLDGLFGTGIKEEDAIAWASPHWIGIPFYVLKPILQRQGWWRLVMTVYGAAPIWALVLPAILWWVGVSPLEWWAYPAARWAWIIAMVAALPLWFWRLLFGWRRNGWVLTPGYVTQGQDSLGLLPGTQVSGVELKKISVEEGIFVAGVWAYWDPGFQFGRDRVRGWFVPHEFVRQVRETFGGRR